MGFKSRTVKRAPKAVVVQARPEDAPGWWPKDANGEPAWVYLSIDGTSSWSTIAEPRENYVCEPSDVKDITDFFLGDYGPEIDDEGNEDPGLGTIQFRTRAA